jgi:uncharacterized protein
MRADAVWAAVRWPGLEHAALSGTSRAPRLDSLAVLLLDERPVRVSCRLTCDADWRVRRLAVAVSGSGATAVTRLALRADGEGRWTDDARHGPVPELDGCTDVDLSCTPLTNTLPIRRLGMAPGMTRDILVAYIKVPELTISAVAQRYTRTSHDGYRYESGSFHADLLTDEHGLVLDYPGAWRRLPVSQETE